VLNLRRGFDLDPADRVVIIEDVLTTGGSTRETMEVARQKGADIVAAGAVINRSGSASPVNVPFAALAALTPPTYKPEACPFCERGIPVTKPGSRADTGSAVVGSSKYSVEGRRAATARR
jgi:orotate phosphoribosyltransferase